MTRRVLAVLALSGCAQSTTMCPRPSLTAETGSLTIEHVHEFGRNYEVFDVSYKVDDCMLLRATDTSVLRQETVDLGRYMLLPGPHQLVITTQFRSDFVVGGSGYVWAGRREIELDVPAGAQLKLTVRYFEEPGADPRYRMRNAISVEDQANGSNAAR